MLISRAFKPILTLVAVAALISGSGCCRDLAKPRAHWTRTDDAHMPVAQMQQRVEAAMVGSGLIPNAYNGNLYAGKNSETSPYSLAFVWRKGVWICTGAPAELVGGVTFGLLFALPSAGWSLIAFERIWQGVDDDLASNNMTFRFETEDLGNGWTRGTSTIESLGMTSKARYIRKSLWSRLDREFPKMKAPVEPEHSSTD